MNIQNKNSIKMLFSIAGIAGASIFLNLPAFAQINYSTSRSNQLYTFSTDSTAVKSENLLAQARTENESTPNTPTNRTDTTPTFNPPTPPTGGATNTRSSNTPTDRNTQTPASSSTDGNRSDLQLPSPSNDESRLLRGGWFCLNNPSPKCS